MLLQYTFYGTTVHFLIENIEIQSLAIDTLAQFGFSPCQQISNEAACIIDFQNTKKPLPCPSIPSSAIEYHNDINAWLQENEVWLTDGHLQACIRNDHSLCQGFVTPILALPELSKRRKLTTLIVLCLFIMLRPRGLYPLHGGALSQDGQGVLLVADSGHGKSTLSFGLVRAGWQYLSDDSIFLRHSSGNIEALAFRKNFGLLPEAQLQFPEIASVWRNQFTQEDKQCIPMDDIYPSQAVDHCYPRIILFPEIEDSPSSRLVEVDATQTLFELIGQSALVTLEPQRATDHIELLKSLLHQCQTYRLFAGHDLRDHPPLLSNMLTDLLHSSQYEHNQTS